MPKNSVVVLGEGAEISEQYRLLVSQLGQLLEVLVMRSDVSLRSILTCYIEPTLASPLHHRLGADRLGQVQPNLLAEVRERGSREEEEKHVHSVHHTGRLNLAQLEVWPGIVRQFGQVACYGGVDFPGCGVCGGTAELFGQAHPGQRQMHEGTDVGGRDVVTVLVAAVLGDENLDVLGVGYGRVVEDGAERLETRDLLFDRLEISLALVICFYWKLRYVQDPDGIDASLNQVV